MKKLKNLSIVLAFMMVFTVVLTSPITVNAEVATVSAEKIVKAEEIVNEVSKEEFTTKKLNEQLVMATAWMQASAEYRAICYQTFNWSKMVLDNDLAKNTSKMPRAIIVDADETIIDNTAYQAHLIDRDYGYSSKTWAAWMQDAEAIAIPGAVEFLNYAADKGVEVFYVTNRKMVGYEGTVKNLKDLGFPHVDKEHLMLRVDTSNKDVRREAVKKDHRVVLYMGDNLNDFSSDFAKKSIEERFTLTDNNKDKFGTQYIVLPNPTYGEWVGTMYNGNWGASPQEKSDMAKNSLRKWNNPREFVEQKSAEK
ncbi:MAG: 5'-nucleotidase, lipoprotein e(P4) family [Marinisporobacter sp.]|nr:5'-nucleotidase, lipoprotein e(P4) family [Marinisporobacter sp.]